MLGEGSPLFRYRDAPRGTRLHVSLRWRLFPFAELLPFIPKTGDVVDLGCGHGLFSLVLATARPGLSILGIDPDKDKIALAQKAAAGLANLRFAVGRAEDVAVKSCDLISLIDVLYLIPEPAQKKLLAEAAAGLRPGGRLLVKEMSERPRWKALWNRSQEFLSVRLLRITHGQSFHFRSEAEWTRLLKSLGLHVRTVRLDAGYLHPHLLFIAER